MKICLMTLKEQQQRYPLSSGKIDKYEYLTGEKILSLQQYKIIQEAKLKTIKIINKVYSRTHFNNLVYK